MSQQTKATVLVVDDHPMLREGVVQLIASQPDMTVCGEAESVKAAENELQRHEPDLMLLDLRLGKDDALEFIKALRARFEKMRILVYSQHDEALFAERVLRAGARGYLMKEEASTKLLEAIRTVLSGERYLSRKLAARLSQEPLEEKEAEKNAAGSPANILTDRELHVFQLVGAGMSTKQIATTMGVSPKTIEAHRENIKRKLSLRDARELLNAAAEWVG